MSASIFSAILAFVLLSATPLGAEDRYKNYMIVWNVGQGQWSTLKDESGCHHFDMGGEHSPVTTIAHLCSKLKNYIYLSHWDWDHISFVGSSARYLPNRCLVLGPLGTSTWKKTQGVSALTKCQDDPHFPWKELTHLTSDAVDSKKISSNGSSHVVLADGQFLIPGDSDRPEEKTWSHDVDIAKTRWLLLGHHGSRTSTSEELLSRIPLAKVAISSARARRYGHPHIEVVALLRQHHIPLLRTEDWGNLWFEIGAAAVARVRGRSL